MNSISDWPEGTVPEQGNAANPSMQPVPAPDAGAAEGQAPAARAAGKRPNAGSRFLRQGRRMQAREAAQQGEEFPPAQEEGLPPLQTAEDGEGGETAQGAAQEGLPPRPRWNKRQSPAEHAQNRDAAARPPRNRPLAPQEPLAGVGFAEVIAGALDTEEEAGAAFPKRVLPPQPELPKLHKVLAQAGLGSRLEMEQLITEGRISVNNEPAHIGQRIQFGDKVRVNGKLLRLNIAPPKPRVLAYHKPAGEVVTHDDPQNRPTVFRKLPRLLQGKWQSVGRLDLNTEGLLLFTSSGELANKLMHPSFGLTREYAVRVLGGLSDEEKQRLLDGVQLDDGMAQFGSIDEGGGEGANHWYRVTISEGRNREVRRMFEVLGHAVSRLIRIRYGSIALPRGLRRGFYVELGERDIRALTAHLGMTETASQPGQGRFGGKGRVPRGPGAGMASKQRGWRRPPQGEGAAQPQAYEPYDAPTPMPEQGQAAMPADAQGARPRRERFERKPRRERNPMQGQGGYGDAQPPYASAQGQAQREEFGEDDFSQKGVSHESPFEKKATRKKIFTQATQMPPGYAAGAIKRSTARANFGAARKGGGKGGAAGGIDPMQTSYGYMGSGTGGGAGYGGAKPAGSNFGGRNKPAGKGGGRGAGTGGRMGGGGRGRGAGGGARGGMA